MEKQESGRAPRVFISYAWEDDDYRSWVEGLATSLRRDGVDARLDAWHQKAGQTFVEFMNSEARQAARILVVGSPAYRAKVHAHEDAEGVAGVGWESMLAGVDVFRGERDKLAFAVGRGPREEALPHAYSTHLAYDLAGADAQEQYAKLVADLLGHGRQAPVLGPPPAVTERSPGPTFARPALGAGQAASASESDVELYRSAALAEYERLSMLGLGERHVKLRVDLDDLHVPLRAVVDRQVLGTTRYDSAADAEGKLHGTEGLDEVPMAEAFRIATQRGKRPGFVLLGDPGSGKTTHLKQLVVWLLRGKDPAAVGLPVGVVPLFLPLRKLSLPGDLELDLDALLDREVASLAKFGKSGFASAVARDRPVLYLLDGLDEVADAGHREQLVRWLERALRERRQRQAYFALTCRYAGYQEDVQLRGEDLLLELHLRPLDGEQIERFVHSWYDLVERQREDPERAKERAPQRAQALLRQLHDPAFGALGTSQLIRNPLLLTVLCVVQLRSQDRLPERRADLYQRCVDILLEDRAREAKGMAPRITKERGRAVLGEVATWLHTTEGRQRASRDELLPLVRASLARGGGNADEAESYLQTIRDESGLLTGWSGQDYGFLHLGFQEYLVAWQALHGKVGRDAALAQLAAGYGTSWWREPILLFAQLADAAALERLLGLCCLAPGFGGATDVLDRILLERRDVSLAPLRSLLDREPGGDASFHRAQLAALLAIERREPQEVEGRRAALREHPLFEIRERYRPALDGLEIEVEPLSGIELVRIPPGEFRMGSPEAELGRFGDEGPQRPVRVSGLWLARTPVTNEQYGRFLAATPEAAEPWYWHDAALNHPLQPVVGVSWDEAQAFCAWAGLRLPSEAEWEYACRGAMPTRYWSGDSESDLARVGWAAENSGGRLHPVGELPANDFGLCDVHGNIWEWCGDPYGSLRRLNRDGAVGVGRKALDFLLRLFQRGSVPRVYRGGSFGFPALFARSAFRNWWPPSDRYYDLGFRPARIIPD
ncbi:MAG: SUMF1/EgtB/PvdO family nonheme iron enzyme [Planctomycetota bacterium]